MNAFVSRTPTCYDYHYDAESRTLTNRKTGKPLKSYASFITNKHTGIKVYTGDVYWRICGLQYYTGFFNKHEFQA